MPLYMVLKRFYYPQVPRWYQPYIWKPLPAPLGKLHGFPKDRIGLRRLAHNLMARYGPGRYRVLRLHVEGEKNRWKPVVYFLIREDGRVLLEKRYTQYTSHPGEATQAFWKEHQPRGCTHVDIGERYRQYREQLLQKIRGKHPGKTS